MSFFKTLAALFVRDAVNSHVEAKKERSNVITQQEREDNAKYNSFASSYSCLLKKIDIAFKRILEREADNIDFSQEKITQIEDTINAYPFYAVLREQGGGVEEIQEKFLKSLNYRTITGNDIISAAKGLSPSKAESIEEAAISSKKFGRIWVELLSIPSLDKDALKKDVGVMVEKMAEIAKEFALVADVIAESLLVDDILNTFKKEAARPREDILPNHTELQAAILERKHAQELYAYIEDYCSLINLETDGVRMLLEASLYGIAYKNLKGFLDKITGIKFMPLSHLAVACEFKKIKPEVDWTALIENPEEWNSFMIHFIEPYPSRVIAEDNPLKFLKIIFNYTDKEKVDLSMKIYIECFHVLSFWAEETEKKYKFNGLSDAILTDMKHNVSDVMIGRLDS